MSEVKSAAERYWVIYYLVYLAAAGVGLWYYWPRLLWYWRQPLLQNDSVYLLAAIFGTAVGIALATAIILEVSGRMVLLIPAAVRKIKAQGHAEGREEGLEEGRVEGLEEGRVEGREEGLEEGRVEGREEGRVEGRQEGASKERQRIGQVLAELGFHDGNGGQVILDSDAVRKILNDGNQAKL